VKPTNSAPGNVPRVRQREQARTEAAHARAAGEAAAMFGDASDQGESAYLARKAVQPHGVRFTPDGWVLVPMRDASGKLWNVQRIAPVKPTDGGTDKLFLKGGRKSGLWHWCGDPGPIRPGLLLLLVRGLRHGRQRSPGHGPPGCCGL
jgi:putative DNA primase/helicase